MGIVQTWDTHVANFPRLRDSLLRGDFPKNTYYDRVVTLRNKYSLLALKPFQFVE